MDKITDYQVTQQEIKTNGIQAVEGEVLYGEPDDNKKLFDRLVTFAINKYNTALKWLVDKSHEHENKELLDTFSDVSGNWHEHENKELLDSLSQQDLDKFHTHDNKSVLDGISQADINLWNSAAGIPGGDISELLTDYYTKEETYSKTETDNLISSAIEENITAALNASY